MRRLDRDIRRMKFIFDEKKRRIHNNENYIKKAYIVEINDKYIRVYIEEIDLEEKIWIKEGMGYIIEEGKIIRGDEIREIYDEIEVDIHIFVEEDNFINKLRVRWL